MLHALRKLYLPEFMVRDELKKGDIPGAKEVYSSTMGVAWASIVESFLIALISMADTVMVSVVGEQAIAAVGLVNQPRFIVQCLVLSLNVAVTSIAARRKGEGDLYGAVSCLKQGLVLSAITSFALSILIYPLAEPFLIVTGAQSDTIGMASDYFRILLIGLPFNSISLTVSAALRGVGNTRASMNINLLANGVNLVLNYLLIGGNFGFPELGVVGAAIATVIGWLCGFVLAFLSVADRGSFLFLYTRDGCAPRKAMLASMYKVASGSFLEQLCMRAGFFVYARIIAGLGTMMFAAHQILINLMSLSFSFGEGFGIAATSLVGQNLGAKRPDLSIVYGKVCQRVSYISSAIIFFVLAFLGRPMLLLFTKDPGIISVGGTIMYIMGIIIFGQASQLIFMGALRGAGDTKYTAVVSMICIMLLRPILSYVLAYPLGLGLVGAWIGFMCDQFMRLLLTHRRFSSGDWVKIKL
jgi:putative MATE family efflux protein